MPQGEVLGAGTDLRPFTGTLLMRIDWRRPPRLLLLGLLTLLWPALVRAQVSATADVSGQVVTAAGERLGQVLVTLRPLPDGEAREVTTTSSGEFRFGFLPPGRYEIGAERIGFVPTVWRELVLVPGSAPRLRLVLAGTADPAVERRTEPVAAHGLLPGSAEALQSLAIEVPLRRGHLEERALLSSRTDGTLGVEGLPASHTLLVIDGTPFRAASHPALPSAPTATAFADAGASWVAVLPGLTVGWPGSAGPQLSMVSAGGSSAVQLAATGYWSADALVTPSFMGGSKVGFNDLRADVSLRGRLTAGFALAAGVQVARAETPLAPAWSDSAAAGLEAALGEQGSELAGYRAVQVASSENVSGFARADWRVSETSMLELDVHAASQPTLTVATFPYPELVTLEARDLIAGATLRSSLSPTAENELRIAFTGSERSTGAAALPWPVTLVDEGLTLGAVTDSARTAERFFRLSDAVVLRTGAHAFRISAAVSRGTYEYDQPDRSASEYVYGSAAELLAGRGALQRTEGGEVGAEWSAGEVSFGVLDRWRLFPGLELLLGLTAEREGLPGEIALDAEWLRLTDVRNNALEKSAWRLAPRLGLTWDVANAGRWVVDAGVGVQNARHDPRLLARWQADDGSAAVRRVVGDVAWPPSGSAGGASAPRLTILDEDFAAPQTVRGMLSLTHRPDARTTVQASGVLRRTRNLPRGSDLNLLSAPLAHDQYGRPIFGSLVKQSGLLLPDPASNRLFPNYDQVWTFSSDGESSYRGITLWAERVVQPGVAFSASYTFSRTEDDWFGAARSGLLLPAGLDGDWLDGTSDFDVPHRLVLALSARTRAGLALRGLYRMQSGRPFTPGFRTGVDANGDGDMRNDPAFIDPNVAGMQGLLEEWDCLGSATGGYAERNSCRGDTQHALDAGLSYTLPAFGRVRATLLVDAFDLLEGSADVPDAALYLVDPAAPLLVDAAARVATVPLLVNPSFGEPLTRRHSGRQLRLGVSVTW